MNSICVELFIIAGGSCRIACAGLIALGGSVGGLLKVQIQPWQSVKDTRTSGPPTDVTRGR